MYETARQLIAGWRHRLERMVCPAARPVPRVRHILELSTAHLPHRWGAVELDSAPGVVAHATDTGWLMLVPDDPAAHAARCLSYGVPPIPAEMTYLQRYARRHGCDYIRFDRDADTDPALPRWDW